MPFKTRKQKQTASERRFTFVENQVVYKEVEKNPTESARSADTKRIIETVNTSSDLLKILMAASVVITVQIVLSLTLR